MEERNAGLEGCNFFLTSDAYEIYLKKNHKVLYEEYLKAMKDKEPHIPATPLVQTSLRDYYQSPSGMRSRHAASKSGQIGTGQSLLEQFSHAEAMQLFVEYKIRELKEQMKGTCSTLFNSLMCLIFQ